MRTARTRPWAFAPRAVRYAVDWFANPARSREKLALPTILNLPITDNCNSRCIMCDVWKTHSENELTLSQLTTILSDPLFRRIEHVGVSGGEPSLRKELPELIQILPNILPRLRAVSITTHGYHWRRWQYFLPRLSEIATQSSVRITLNLSIDGSSKVHDQVRRIPGGFDRILKTYELAKNEGVPVEIQTTVMPTNVHNLGSTLDLARELNAEIIYRQATTIPRLNNERSMESQQLSANEQSFFADFLEAPRTRSSTSSLGRRLFYEDLARRLSEGGRRNAPCFFQREGILLTPRGDLHHCSISTEPLGNALEVSAHALYFSEKSRSVLSSLLTTECPSCVHDQSGAWHPRLVARALVRASGVGELIRKGVAGVNFLLASSYTLMVETFREKLAYDSSRSIELPSPGLERSALLIGNYGGEHVGDAAILGGVAERLRRDYNVVRSYVASIRPHRTRRWISAIHSKTEFDVVAYQTADLKRLIKSVDVVVLAGGPLMDLPTLLLKHLRLVARCRREGIPFIVEGIGIGPFASSRSRGIPRPMMSKMAKVIASKLLRMANKVTVRSFSAGSSNILNGVQAHYGRDPAFDYLESQSAPKKLSARERYELETLLTSPSDGLKIGINLRPLWDRYSTGAEVMYVEEEFLGRFASALNRLDTLHPLPISYVFFPMNADQYGFSDLQTGYLLADRIGSDISLAIWESEPGVDAIIELMNQVDIVIGMRLHACVFAISQGIPTIGIDYQVGAPGKVTELFNDLGMVDMCTRVERFSDDWLYSALGDLLRDRV